MRKIIVFILLFPMITVFTKCSLNQDIVGVFEHHNFSGYQKISIKKNGKFKTVSFVKSSHSGKNKIIIKGSWTKEEKYNILILSYKNYKTDTLILNRRDSTECIKSVQKANVKYSRQQGIFRTICNK